MTSDYRDIMVICETRQHPSPGLARSSLEVLAKARELADQLGARVEAFILGSEGVEALAEPAIHQGADVALVAQSDDLILGNIDAFYAAVLPVIRERKPEIVLMSANSLGLDLAPRLGAGLGTGALSDATKLEIDETERLLVAKRLTYDGSVEALATIPRHRPQIASLRPGAARPAYPDESRYGRVETVEVDIPASAKRVRLVSMEDAPMVDPPLRSAEIVVGGGAGMGEEFALIRDLAHALGGAPAASRAAVHEGLAPEALHVGATGAKITPKMYVACGISGAFEHWLGLVGTGVVVAVNPDKSAPIFQRAQYGLVGEAGPIIRGILEELQKN
ncbi:MAG: electron transfer flavoprotein subunit alpha/FixB family protein [Thermoplasmatota archaeon]